jgi:hypothetical protein
MSMTYRITKEQLQAAEEFAGRFSGMTLHPYSGVVTLSTEWTGRGDTVAMIDQDGTVTYQVTPEGDIIGRWS